MHFKRMPQHRRHLRASAKRRQLLLPVLTSTSEAKGAGREQTMTLRAMNWKGPTAKAGTYILYILGALVIWQNVSLNRTIDGLRNPPPGVYPGTPLRHIAGITPDGQYREVTDKDLSKAIIVTLSPGCQYCISQQAKWMSLAKQLPGKGNWHILWISDASPAATKTYCDKYSIPKQDTLSNPAYSTYLQLNMRSVPTTLVIKNSIVTDQWFGTLKPADWNKLNTVIAS